jgi:lysozyme family protein
MASFTLALPFILKHEGTELFEDKVNGERSRYGITMKLLRAISYQVTDPNNLMPADVENVYCNVFWIPNKLIEIESQLVANKILDMAVNMGSFTAIRLLQASLNSVGALCVIDGIMGPHTTITINEFLRTDNAEERLLSELVIKAIAYYKQIATGSKAQYLAGWITRAEDIGTGVADKVAFSTLRDGGKDKVIKG